MYQIDIWGLSKHISNLCSGGRTSSKGWVLGTYCQFAKNLKKQGSFKKILIVGFEILVYINQKKFFFYNLQKVF